MDAGSSPLTRGKRRRLASPTGGRRLIPAHAGKTGPSHSRRACPGAHPRSRGENKVIGQGYSGAWGSSPLTRGKPLRGLPGAGPQGLIPAHAGKTTIANELLSAAGAHPRSRGENSTTPGRRLADTGSSPLTRGKRPVRRDGRTPAGLIPAHAGKTMRAGRATRAGAAHPRSRGENPPFASWNDLMAGSSPLTRGKPPGPTDVEGEVGLIPAHAGKTHQPRRAAYQAGAHPRSRGENSGTASRPRSTTGSSPLTRGKRYDQWNRWDLRGLIPAHAGKTARAWP